MTKCSLLVHSKSPLSPQVHKHVYATCNPNSVSSNPQEIFPGPQHPLMDIIFHTMQCSVLVLLTEPISLFCANSRSQSSSQKYNPLKFFPQNGRDSSVEFVHRGEVSIGLTREHLQPCQNLRESLSGAV